MHRFGLEDVEGDAGLGDPLDHGEEVATGRGRTLGTRGLEQQLVADPDRPQSMVRMKAKLVVRNSTSGTGQPLPF